MNTGRWIRLAGFAAVLLLGSSGCATKGYVRNQVAGVRTDMAQMQTGMQADIHQAQLASTEASAKADAATGAIRSTQDMALGHVGYQEAKRYRIHFAFDSDQLDDTALSTLDEAASEIALNQHYLVELLGFTDPVGSEAYNYQLGWRRAQAVLRYLTPRTPDQLSRYQSVSFGKTPPDGEAAGLGEANADRRQVAIVLVERTPQSGTPAISEREK